MCLSQIFGCRETPCRTPAPAPPPAHKGPPSTHPWPDVQPAQHGQPALLGRAGRHPLYLALGLGLQCRSPIGLNARNSESAIFSLRYLDLWSVYQTLSPKTCTKVFHQGKTITTPIGAFILYSETFKQVQMQTRKQRVKCGESYQTGTNWHRLAARPLIRPNIAWGSAQVSSPS